MFWFRPGHTGHPNKSLLPAQEPLTPAALFRASLADTRGLRQLISSSRRKLHRAAQDGGPLGFRE